KGTVRLNEGSASSVTAGGAALDDAMQNADLSLSKVQGAVRVRQQNGEWLEQDVNASSGYVAMGTDGSAAIRGPAAFMHQYQSWGGASGLAKTVGAFVTGAGNFVNALGIPMGIAVALMGVLVASFAGTTMDTACRLQRYVIQELAAALLSWRWR